MLGLRTTQSYCPRSDAAFLWLASSTHLVKRPDLVKGVFGLAGGLVVCDMQAPQQFLSLQWRSHQVSPRKSPSGHALIPSAGSKSIRRGLIWSRAPSAAGQWNQRAESCSKLASSQLQCMYQGRRFWNQTKEPPEGRLFRVLRMPGKVCRKS